MERFYYAQKWVQGSGWSTDSAYSNCECALVSAQSLAEATGCDFRVVVWDDLEKLIPEVLAHFVPVHKRFRAFVLNSKGDYDEVGSYSSVSTALVRLRRLVYDQVAIYDLDNETFIKYERSSTYGRRFKRTSIEWVGDHNGKY